MAKSNNPVVWVSAAPMDSTRIRGFNVDIVEEDRRRGVQVLGRIEMGKPVKAEELPKTFYSNNSRDNKKRPDFFLANGVWIVSEPFAEVLRNYDLGSNHLAKVNLLKTDRKTPIEGSYYCLALSEQKASISLEKSSNVGLFGGGYWALQLFGHENDQIAMGRSALSGPDLWLEQGFTKAFFLSNRLVSALRQAKVTRFLKLYRCRVLAGE